jgi:hypothetical protein
MIRFFNRRSRKKSRDFKYNSSKTSLQNQFTLHEQDSHGIIGTSDGTIPIRRHAYETGIGGGADYGTYSSVNSGFVGGNRPRYSSINALGSKESGQDSPPEIVQYLRPPQNYSSPVRDSNAQMKDIPLTLPSPNRPPRSKDRKSNTNINTDNNNQSSINSVQQQSNNLQMATSRTSPFTSDTSSPSFHSPTSIPTSSRHHFPSLKPIHMSPSGTEQSKLNKHIDSYKLQQGKAAADSAVPPLDLPSAYGMNTRRKLLGVNQKQPSAGTVPSNSESPESRTNPNSLPVTTGEIPHRSLPKPPEIPSCINGPYVATSRGGNASGPASYVSRHTKIPSHEINDYAHLRQRVLVGQ